MDDSAAPSADVNRLAAAYLEAAPDAIVGVDGYGIITLVNRQAETLFGYSSDELIGESIELLVPTNRRRVHVGHRKRYAADAQVRIMGAHAGRLHGLCKDGTLVPVDVALSPIEVDGHSGAIAIVRDVRSHIKAEAEYEIVQRTLDAVEDAVFMIDPNSLEFVYVNEGAQSQVGFDRYMLTSGMRLHEIMPEFSEMQVRELLRPLIQGDDSSVSLTTVHRHQAGHDVPVDILLHYPRISGDAPRRIVSIVRDITERQAAEDRLRASEAGFRSAFIDAPVAMVLTTEEGEGTSEIVEANHAFYSMLGFREADLTGHPLSELLVDDGGSAEKNADGSTERRYQHRDGHQIWGAVHLSELQHPDGERRRLSHIVNVTRRVEAERQRDRREQLFSSLAEIRQATLLEQAVDSVLELTLRAVSQLLDAPHAFVAVPSVEGSMVYRSVVSTMANDLAGRELPQSPAIRQVIDTGRPGALLSLADLDADSAQIGPAYIAPLHGSGALGGILVAARPVGAEGFTDDEVAVGLTLAAEIAVTLDLAKARSERRRLFLIEDRERIARDLHDVVIQRLFAAGMGLQASLGAHVRLEEKALTTIDELDETINVIRETIFQLTQPDLSGEGELRRVIDRYQAVGRNGIDFAFEGDLDQVNDIVLDNLSATLSELLSNVERHADANVAVVRLAISDSVTLTVSDDGVGYNPDGPHGFGIRNINQRADYLGGKMHIKPGPDGVGTTVTWSVPQANGRPN